MAESSSRHDIEWGPSPAGLGSIGEEAQGAAHAHGGQVEIQPRSENIETNEAQRQQPWKHVGYRGYADFIASDDSRFVLRRFSALGVRVALSLQHELAVLERELADLDATYARDADPEVSNGCFEEDQEDREMLLRIIGEKLRRYYKFIALQTSSRKYQTPTRENVDALVQWHRSYRDCAIDRDEQAYLMAGTDLLRVVACEGNPLWRAIGWPRKWKDGLRGRHQARPHASEHHADRLYGELQPERWDATFLATATVGGVMLVAPLWIMQILEARERLAMITAFLGVALFGLSASMPGRPLETLVATAVYAAVLMVFATDVV